MAEYILYCHESEKSGKFYSNFYGGVLVSSKNLNTSIQTLEKAKVNLNFFGEVKWSKVTELYLGKYIELMFFFN